MRLLPEAHRRMRAHTWCRVPHGDVRGPLIVTRGEQSAGGGRIGVPIVIPPQAVGAVSNWSLPSRDAYSPSSPRNAWTSGSATRSRLACIRSRIGPTAPSNPSCFARLRMPKVPVIVMPMASAAARARRVRTMRNLPPHRRRNQDAAEQLSQEVKVLDAGQNDEGARVADNNVTSPRGHAGAGQSGTESLGCAIQRASRPTRSL